MNNSYPVQVGSLAFVKCSDEPVFVINIDENGKCVVRRKMGDDYVEEDFLVAELSTAKRRIVDELDLQLFSFDLKAKYQTDWDNKRKKDLVPTITPPPANGGGSLAN